MPPAVLEIPAAVLGKEELSRKIYTDYDPSKKYTWTDFLDYRSTGPTRIERYGHRHVATPFGYLPSCSTVLGNTMGNKAALERWLQKTPADQRYKAAERGTAIHAACENYLAGIEKNPKFDNEELEAYWEGMPKILDKLHHVIWSEGPLNDDFGWTRGSDGVCRLWTRGRYEDKVWGCSGTPDGIGLFGDDKRTVLFDFKTSVNLFRAKWPGPETPKDQYAKARSGFMKLQKAQTQMAGYAIMAEETLGIKPQILMTIVSTTERCQLFVIQGSTIEKYKQKFYDCLDKFYTEVLPKWQEDSMDFEVIDGEKEPQ